MRKLTRSNQKVVAGVAAGFAQYFEMDTTIWRAIWLIGCIVMPPALLAYVILAVVMPPAEAGVPASETVIEVPPSREESARTSGRKLTKSHDRWLSGVAAGIAEYFDVDPVLVRAIFLGSILLGGTGLLAYIILAILMPRPQYQYR